MNFTECGKAIQHNFNIPKYQNWIFEIFSFRSLIIESFANSSLKWSVQIQIIVGQFILNAVIVDCFVIIVSAFV